MRRGVLRRAVGKRCRVLAGKTMVGELRTRRIARFFAHGAVDAIDREEGERVRADELPHAFKIVRGGKQLVLLRRVDAVIVGMRDRR